MSNLQVRQRRLALIGVAVICGLLVIGSFIDSCRTLTHRSATSVPFTGTLTEKLRSLGIGMWLWQPELCPCTCTVKHNRTRRFRKAERREHYANLAAQAKRYNLGFVLIKVHDGTKPFHRFYPELIEAFAKEDVKVLVWGYNYCTKPAQEAYLIHQYMHLPGVVGYVANTEAHVKGKHEETELMMALLSSYRRDCATCQHKLIGYAPYAYPSVHSSLPYAVLNKYSDFVAPQMYWGTMGRTVQHVVSRTYREWSHFEAKQIKTGINRSIPILPIGQSYGRAKPGEIRDFLHRTRGYYATSFWDWQHATPWMWEEIRDANRRLASR